MPMYEYRCEEDGSVLELRRSMADADAPVEDPEGRGRTFVRAISSFSTGGSASAGRSMALPRSGGCCPCGKTSGGCGGR